MRTISIAALLAATLASGAIAQTAPAPEAGAQVETPAAQPPAASPKTAPAEKMEPAPAPTAPEAAAPTTPAPTAETAPSPTDAPAATANEETLETDKVDDLEVTDASGKALGEIGDVYMGPGDKPFVTVSHGGFLGLGSTETLVALDQFTWNGEKLVAKDLNPDSLKAMPAFKETAEYRELDDKDLVKVTRQ